MTENDIIYRKACEILEDGKTNIISLTLAAIIAKGIKNSKETDK